MRLIDADELLKGKSDHEMISTHLIFNAPTVDAKPVVKGKWIVVNEQIASCSVCHRVQHTNGKDKTGRGVIFSALYRYCPKCGADMKGGR